MGIAAVFRVVNAGWEGRHAVSDRDLTQDCARGKRQGGPAGGEKRARQGEATQREAQTPGRSRDLLIPQKPGTGLRSAGALRDNVGGETHEMAKRNASGTKSHNGKDKT